MMKSSELLEILKNKYIQISEELKADLSNVNLEEGFISLNKNDINKQIFNSKNCTFTVIESKEQDVKNSFINTLYIKKAKSIIILVIHNQNLTLYKIYEMLNYIENNLDKKTKIIIGDYIDKTIDNQIKLVSLILQ